jgi:nucleotide-binding universal stress UspA family protein
MIVLASASLGALDSLAFGGVADRVVRRSPAPVFVVRPGGASASAEIRRLVVPLDGSQRAMQALPAAAELGNRLGASVALVTVIDPTRTVPPTEVFEAVLTGGFRSEVLAGLQGDAEETQDAAATALGAPNAGVARFVRYGSISSCVLRVGAARSWACPFSS